MNADRDLATEPLDELDERILTSLADVLRAADPVPAGLADDVKFALTVQALHAEVAELQRVGAESALARSEYTRTQTLTFSAETLSVMVTLSPIDAEEVRVERVDPPAGQTGADGVGIQPLGLDAAAPRHDDGPVGDLLQLGEDVARDQHRPALGRERAQDVAQLDPAARVEARGRFVEQQDAGVVDQRPGDGGPLPHAAGQLGGPGVLEAAQPHEVDQLVDPLLRRAHPCHVPREADVLGDAAPREQSRRLWHDSDLLALQRTRRRAALHRDGPAGRRLEATDEPQQGRLAASRGAEQADERAGLDPQRQRSHDLQLPERPGPERP